MILEMAEKRRWDWKTHILSVVDTGNKLAEKYDADSEVVELSCWLHDITKMKGGEKEHNIKPALDQIHGVSNT